MTERERVVAILSDLALPLTQYVVAGSGVLILHGVTAEERGKPMGDLDIFCATRLWFDLANDVRPLSCDWPRWKVWTTHPDDPARRCDPPYLYTVMYGLEVNIFHSWRKRGVGDIDVAHWIHNAEHVGGWPCTTLQDLLDWKRTVGRAKDVADMRILERILGAQAA